MTRMDSISIELRLFGNFREHLPEGNDGFSCRMPFEEGHTVGDLLRRVNIPPELAKIILVNGVHAGLEHLLQQNDTVAVFPPVAGG